MATAVGAFEMNTLAEASSVLSASTRAEHVHTWLVWKRWPHITCERSKGQTEIFDTVLEPYWLKVVRQEKCVQVVQQAFFVDDETVSGTAV